MVRIRWVPITISDIEVSYYNKYIIKKIIPLLKNEMRLIFL